MALELRNVRISNGVTGISVPEGAPVTVDNLEIVDTKTGIEVRDDPSLAARIGIPGAPSALIIEAIRTLQNSPATSPEERGKVLRSTKVWEWIGRASDVAGVVGALSSLVGFAISLPR